MIKTLRNAWKTAELRNKLVFTAFILILYRLGAVIPMPYVNGELMASVFGSATGGSMFQYLNILSGEAFSKATLFALSISPYITSSIVIQLLTIAIPALERLQKSGEEGRKKITQLTRYITVALALIMSFGYYQVMRNTSGILTDRGNTVFGAIVIIAVYCAGSSLIMWLGEKINENGIGNGISMILFANIVASTPTIVSSMINLAKSGTLAGILTLVIGVIVALAIVYFVVFMTHSERRLPVQYAKRVVGRKMYGGQSSNLPIKINMNGVMPIIFANAIVSLPTTIMLFFNIKEGGFWAGLRNALNYTSPVYWVVNFLLIIAFAYFYVAISFNPVEVSNNLKKNGGFIPGIRPGKPTSDYIKKVLNKVTLIGAIFLGVVAVLPLVLGSFAPNLSGFAFGGSSLLIVVGVILETEREIEAQLTMRHYKGFLE
ncbi:MAG: preprotein translocase subunit SecY [Clostridia bacterium]|nr:preprotein translocase subunit SecY [Clostridia bacterium]